MSQRWRKEQAALVQAIEEREAKAARRRRLAGLWLIFTVGGIMMTILMLLVVHGK